MPLPNAAQTRRQAKADEMNATLRGSGISVRAGGAEGPYAVVVERLSLAQAERVVRVVSKELKYRPP